MFDIIEKNRTTYKQTTMLTILLTGDNPNAFEMRYWARVKDRRYNLIDINVMCRSAYAEFDFIVFRLPSTSVSLLNNSILKPQNYMPIYLVKAQNTL